MKIVLVSLYSGIANIGVRTLSASLKKEGYNVQIIFLRSEFWNRYEDRILNELGWLIKDANLIGISLTTNYFENAIQVTQSMRKNSNAIILWGGIHPTIRPEECLDYADIVCIGEGEETLVELTKKMENGQNLSDVQGIWYKDKKGKIVRNKYRPLIETLDSIPFPDYHYEDHYILTGKHIEKMNIDVLKTYLLEGYSTMASRGCPFGCTYCCNNTLNKMYPNQKLIRKRSWDNIIKEISEVKKALPFIRRIIFEDDAFFSHTAKEIKEFCVTYKRDVGLPMWIGGGTPINLTREKIELLSDAGLERLRMGIQAGNERTRRLYKRYYSNQKVEEAARILNEFKDKIIPSYDIILDNPWESDEDLIEGLMLMAKLSPPYVLIIFSLTFFPETELYEKAKADGLITNDRKDVYCKHYTNCKKTYLNRLYFLLQMYIRRESSISPKVMFLLTNKRFRQLKLSWLLYFMLIIWEKVITLRYFLYNGLRDIAKADMSRISGFIKRKLKADVI